MKPLDSPVVKVLDRNLLLKIDNLLSDAFGQERLDSSETSEQTRFLPPAIVVPPATVEKSSTDSDSDLVGLFVPCSRLSPADVLVDSLDPNPTTEQDLLDLDEPVTDLWPQSVPVLTQAPELVNLLSDFSDTDSINQDIDLTVIMMCFGMPKVMFLRLLIWDNRPVTPEKLWRMILSK